VTRLLLASASPARLRTLQAAGVEPVIRQSGVDEDAILAEAAAVNGPVEPADAAMLLARAKAEAVAAHVVDVIVLGCDSVLELNGRANGKPATPAAAAGRWRAMRGSSGLLHTGHCLVDTRPDGRGETLGALASTRVHFADLTDDEIDAYVATGEPLHVAGAFTIDGLGGPFVTGIEGDHHNVVGLSLPLLRHLLARLDVTWTDLWDLR